MNAPESLAEARRADRIARRTRELVAARQRQDQAEKIIGIAVAGLHRDGLSWGQIAQLLGVSRQAAQQRYSSR